MDVDGVHADESALGNVVVVVLDGDFLALVSEEALFHDAGGDLEEAGGEVDSFRNIEDFRHFEHKFSD